MEGITVYLVEHKSEPIELRQQKNTNILINKGPYLGFRSKSADKMGDAHNDNYTHPSIRNDISKWSEMGFKFYDHFCCFTNIEQLKTWFDGFLVILNRRGFVIAEYIIEHDGVIVGESNTQAVFDINKVLEKKIIGKLSINVKIGDC